MTNELEIHRATQKPVPLEAPVLPSLSGNGEHGKRKGEYPHHRRGSKTQKVVDQAVRSLKRNTTIRARVARWWHQSRVENMSVDDIVAAERVREGGKPLSASRTSMLVCAYDLVLHDFHPEFSREAVEVILLSFLSEIRGHASKLWEPNPELPDDPTKGELLKWHKESLGEHSRHQLFQGYMQSAKQYLDAYLRIKGLLGAESREEEDLSGLPKALREKLLQTVVDAQGGDVEVSETTRRVTLKPRAKDAEVVE